MSDTDVYNIIQQLGKGTYGNVYLVSNKENEAEGISAMK